MFGAVIILVFSSNMILFLWVNDVLVYAVGTAMYYASTFCLGVV